MRSGQRSSWMVGKLFRRMDMVIALCFGAEIPPHKPHGLLSLEHSGRPANSNDGCCLTLLISLKVPLESVCLIDKYSWLELDRMVGDQLLARL